MLAAPTQPTAHLTARASRAQLLWLLVAVLLALAIRLPLLANAQSNGPKGDELQYSAQALMNGKGEWFQQAFDPGAPAAEHPPLTSTMLTPVSAVFNDGGFEIAQRLTVLLVGMVNIVLFWLLGRRWSPLVGTLTALIAAVDAHLFLSDVLILSETFGVALMVLLLLVQTVPDEHRRPRRDAALTGLLLGLLLLTRPELTLLVPLICAWRWRTSPARRTWRAVAVAAVPALAALLVVAPWVLWNQARFADSTTLSTNDGFTLLGANCPDTYYGDNIGGYSIFCALSIEGTPDQDASQVSTMRREAATRYARDHVGRLPLVAGARFVRQWEIGWIGRTASDSADEGRPPWLVLAGSIQWWVLGGLAVVGLTQIARRWRWLLLLTPLVVTVAAVTVNAQWRVRSAAEPSVILAAALGITWLLARRAGTHEAEAGVESE